MSSSEPDDSIFAVDLNALVEREETAHEFENLWYSDNFEAMRDFSAINVPILWTLADYLVRQWDPTAFCYAWFRFDWQSKDLHSRFQEKILDVARSLRSDMPIFDGGDPSTRKKRMADKEKMLRDCYKWISILYTLVPEVLDDADVINNIFLPGEGQTSMAGWSRLTPQRAKELQKQWNIAKNTKFEVYDYIPHFNGA